MSSLTVAEKTLLEAALGMSSGYVLDLTDGSFASLLGDVGIDIFDPEKYIGLGTSKANRFRALWKVGTDEEVAAALTAIVDYAEAKQSIGEMREPIAAEHVSRVREIASRLLGDARSVVSAPVPITSPATVSASAISIEIHPEIFSHIGPYLATGDHFHAVEESYKLVREKLRELTGSEKASDVFNQASTNTKHYGALFGRPSAASGAEGDFFRGIGYLHLGVQFLRNEKAHSIAAPVEPNLALHYISLASLAYDLITRYVSADAVREIEDLVLEKRRSYRSASAFYRDFEDGKWLDDIDAPGLKSRAVRVALRDKWLAEADLTRSYDHSNVVLMQLELVADVLTDADVDRLLDLPTTDKHGNTQAAGMVQFLEFIGQRHPAALSPRCAAWIAENR